MTLIEKLDINQTYSDFMEEFLEDQIKLLQSKVKSEFYPPIKKVFKFLINDPKVVIVGQDPYPSSNRATGTAFAVEKNEQLPQSLEQIIFALERQFDTNILRFDTTLKEWEDQGVMLMNSALTVRKNDPGSHAGLWAEFVRNLAIYIENNYKPKWVLLGNRAKNLLEDVLAEERVYLDRHPMANVYSSKDDLFKGDFFKEINEIKWI